jgi:hypothetical protein
MCKVQWSHIGEGEATWKREEELRIDFLHYSLVFPKSRGRDFLRGVGFVIPTLLENLKGEIIFLYVHVCHLYLSFHADTSLKQINNKRCTIKLCIMLRFHFVCIICEKIKIT